MVPVSPRPGTIEAADRMTLSWLDASECRRVNLNIRFLVTTLETEVNCAVKAATFNGKDSRRVLNVTQLEYNTVTHAQDISTANTFLKTWMLRRRYVSGGPGAERAPQ